MTSRSTIGPPRSALAAVLLAFVAPVVLAAHARAADPLAAERDEAARAADEFDPFEGIDRDGRIPAIERPADIEHPERWRYVPEGRIKPGNVFQRFLTSSFITPLVFRDDDIGTGGGLSIIDIAFRGQRRREFAGIFGSYTTEGQQNYSIFWRRWLDHIELDPDEGGGVLQEERSVVSAWAGYTKSLTLRFFGLGPETGESDETSYTDERISWGLEVERPWPGPGDEWVWLLGARGELHTLSGGRVSGRPDTGDSGQFPALFADAQRQNMGWIQFGLRYDTRDSQVNPYSGWVAGGRVDAALAQSQGDVGARYGLFASHIFALPGIFHDGGDPDEEHPPTDTLALGVRGSMTSGELPFFSLPSLGGSGGHRGFIDGRFRDRSAWLGEIEHRFWVVPRGFRVPFTEAIRVERLGLATFFELGAVASSASEWVDSEVRYSYGVSFRLTLERQAPFRVDLGFSEDGLNVAAQFGLSF